MTDENEKENEIKEEKKDNRPLIALPILALRNVVLFPNMELPLVMGNPTAIKAINEVTQTEEKELIVFAIKDQQVTEVKADSLYQVGTKAIIKRMYKTEKGIELVLHGEERVKLLTIMQVDPFLTGYFQIFPLPLEEGDKVEALYRAILDQATKLQELIEIQTSVPLDELLMELDAPIYKVFFLAMLYNVGLETEQKLLEAQTQFEALQIMHTFLSHELKILQLKKSISKSADKQMHKQQKEYLLREQMAAIQRELGEKDPIQAEITQLEEKLKEAQLPPPVRSEVEREFNRLRNLPPGAQDYQVIRSYVDLILELPWNKKTEDNLDLARARVVLDEDHYGLQDIKERIIEFLAILKLNPKAKAPIICFVGPPGVGKTSLGESIARALERKFERMSLGGLHDEAELRGHRRTYVGAMPGKIIRSIRRAGVKNPLLMLDELDKIGKDFRGDPSAALMEIIDPSQNYAFVDNYLDLPFDLSQIFFILTANSLEPIPQPLLDRMEVIRLSGYSEVEKLQIATKYLIPQRLQEAGIKEDQLRISEDIILTIIHRYTREAGLRELGRNFARIIRKAAVKIAEHHLESITLTQENLVEYLGAEKFSQDGLRQHALPGVATGLAWTATGGDVLYIEASLLPEGKGLILTGQLGEVMKESAQAAQSFIWSHAHQLGINEEKFKQGVHIHVPAGAIPKDGPSAGITMASALASLYTNLPLRNDLAMTGEITLKGLVLPIGGLKEKSLAALRSGITHIIIPKSNHKDLPEISTHVTDKIQFMEVENLMQVFKLALPQLEERLREFS